MRLFASKFDERNYYMQGGGGEDFRRKFMRFNKIAYSRRMGGGFPEAARNVMDDGLMFEDEGYIIAYGEAATTSVEEVNKP